MKRKVIQIANSTQLISLPRKWAKEHGIKKGDELDIEEDGSQIVVRVEKGEPKVEAATLDVSKLGSMLQRCIDALYRKGVDEIKITYGSKEQFADVLAAVNNTTIGFEVVEQGESYCLVKNVSGYLEEFNSLLRRTFLLILSMGNDSVPLIKSRQYEQLTNLLPLEATTNRLTMICRRIINRGGHQGYGKPGPLYALVKELEELADLYKYLFQYLARDGKVTGKIRPELIELYRETNDLVRQLYQSFYKFDLKDVPKFKDTRNDIVAKCYKLFQAKLSPDEAVLTHHCMAITNSCFAMHGPVMTLFV